MRATRLSMRRLLLLGTGLGTLACMAGVAAFGAPVSTQKTRVAPVSHDAPVTFTADKVEYNRDAGLVTATGHVEAWQNDHVLRADTVTFDRTTNVAAASGHVVIVEPDGQTLFSDYAELTEGMREGVLKGMRAILAENGKMAANGARRTEGKINEMSHAVYSTCNLCKDDPSQAPLWQLRAYSATQDTENKTVEYQDMFLDMFGVPVAYLPWFSHADPSVKRQSGFLVPSIGNSSHIGVFFTAPYYVVLDPQSDVTVTPMITSYPLGNLDLNYRRRFNNGSMSIDVSTGYERPTSATSSDGRTLGGPQAAIFAKGQFAYDEEWRYGFDIQATTSEDYLRDFRLPDIGDVLTSQVYLEGFGVGAYSRLDVRAYQGLTTSVTQKYLPYVLPRYEYSYFGEPDSLGGRLSVDTSAFNVYRDVGTRTQRGAMTAEWQRPFSDDLGQQYNVTLHLDATAYNASEMNQLPNFDDHNDTDTARAQPQVALNYRYPFMRSDSSTGTQMIEPIAQLILAPNSGNSQNRYVPNEDSLDFEFSDANLFSFNRFSGIDRFDGGVRANYALHGSWYDGGTGVDALVGQSYRFHKDDLYPEGSGLNGNASDIVARATFTPVNWLDLTYRTRLDKDNLKTRMSDAVASVGKPLLQFTLGYTYDTTSPYYLYDQAATPASYYTPRNEITLGASTAFDNYKFSGYVRRDLQNNQLIATGATGSYEDECFIFSANMYRRFTSIDGDHGDTTVLFQVTFKTVGQVGYHAF